MSRRKQRITQVGHYRVSTVDLGPAYRPGFDHETLVFDTDNNDLTEVNGERHTREEAAEVHERYIKWAHEQLPTEQGEV